MNCLGHTEPTDIMALLVDKHRPRSLEALTYHHELSARLKSLVGSHVLTLRVDADSCRHKVETSPTSWSTVRPERARRLG